MSTIYVPNELDGSEIFITPPEGYLRISNHTGGFVHNDAEADIVQTDANEAVFGGASFWGDGATWDEKTKAQLDTHYSTVNGDKNLWIKKTGDNTYRVSQYDVTREFTENEYLKNVAYFGGTPVPFI